MEPQVDRLDRLGLWGGFKPSSVLKTISCLMMPLTIFPTYFAPTAQSMNKAFAV